MQIFFKEREEKDLPALPQRAVREEMTMPPKYNLMYDIYIYIYDLIFNYMFNTDGIGTPDPNLKQTVNWCFQRLL